MATRKRAQGNGSRRDDEAAVVNDLRRIVRAIHEYSKSIHRSVGLSSPQVWALRLVSEDPGISLGDLAERMYAHASTVSGVVDRLVKRGLIDRVVPPENRRTVQLSLTAEGRRTFRRCPSPVQSGLRNALARMPAARLRSLRRALDDVVDGAELAGVKADLFE